MRNLRPALRLVIDRSGLNASQFAKNSGLLKSNLSHILSGRLNYVGPKLLGRMLANLDDQEAKEIVEAYLKDEFERVISEADQHSSNQLTGSIQITWKQAE